MFRFVLATLLLIAVTYCIAQKGVIDEDISRKWPVIEYQGISNDGSFALYNLGSDIEKPVLILQATDNSWKVSLTHIVQRVITDDSKEVVVRTDQDSLGIFDIGTRSVHMLDKVKEFRVGAGNSGSWLVYTPSGAIHRIILRNLNSGKERIYSGAERYALSRTARTLLLQGTLFGGDRPILAWVSLLGGEPKIILPNCPEMPQFSFDSAGTALVLTTHSEGGAKVWYYRESWDAALLAADTSCSGWPRGYTVDNGVYGFPRLSPDGRYLFCRLTTADELGRKSLWKQPGVDVWSYKDALLQMEQERRLERGEERGIVVALDSKAPGRVVEIGSTADVSVKIPTSLGPDAALVCTATGNPGEAYWRPAARQNYELVSFKDGRRKVVVGGLTMDVTRPSFSRLGRYIVWYNTVHGGYCSYEVSTGVTRGIGGDIKYSLCRDNDGEGALPQSFGLVGWELGDSALYIYTKFDIWRVDPKGRNPSICITNGFGRKTGTMLRYINLSGDYEDEPMIKKNEPMILYGINERNMQAGYYIVRGGKEEDPEPLAFGPYQYSYPIKAKYADQFLVSRTNDTTYPNLLVSNDLLHFSSLTEFEPQKDVNWYTTELLHFKGTDGQWHKGLLYKPSDFDPGRKYPVIFTYYEQDAGSLFQFIQPVPCLGGDLPIPWMVSRGYLVFDPDIIYKLGKPGPSALNAVSEGQKYLARKRWVDTLRMGLYGVSFGGYETNYIVTKTNKFAAACSASGICDLTSLTYSIRSGEGESAERVSEQTQIRMGGPLWKDRLTYIRNSPVFFADKVSTPMLLMANEKDGKVPWAQGVEWFLALRRLGKRVWMLQYDGEDHTLVGWKNRVDFTQRLLGFYDYYLKSGPAPLWMTKGIDFVDKNSELGFEMDRSGLIP